MLVAQALDPDLRERVVFIGASILPLLQTDPRAFASPRPTGDVDAITMTVRYTDFANVERQLRELGFVEDRESFVGRWRTPSGVTFDLAAAGDHTGGTGATADRLAIENAVRLDLPPVIRHVTALGFFSLKCAAYWERGAQLPTDDSKDISDLVTLLATRPGIVNDCVGASRELADLVRRDAQSLLSSQRIRDSFQVHINLLSPTDDTSDVEELVTERLSALATGC